MIDWVSPVTSEIDITCAVKTSLLISSGSFFCWSLLDLSGWIELIQKNMVNIDRQKRKWKQEK